MNLFKKKTICENQHLSNIRLMIKGYCEDNVYEPQNLIKMSVNESIGQADEHDGVFRVVNIYVEDDNSVRADLAGLRSNEGHIYGYKLENLDDREAERIFVKVASEFYQGKELGSHCRESDPLIGLLVGA